VTIHSNAPIVSRPYRARPAVFLDRAALQRLCISSVNLNGDGEEIADNGNGAKRSIDEEI